MARAPEKRPPAPVGGGLGGGAICKQRGEGVLKGTQLQRALREQERIRIFRYTLAPEPLEHTDHRPLHNLERPLTRRHESSRKRYTMALAGTALMGALEQAERFRLWRRISANANLWRKGVPSGQIYGAKSTPNVGMAEIRRYNPMVWSEIYAIPTFGGVVWRKHAV